MKKLIVNKEYPNGIEIDLTAEEIAQKKIDEQNSIANFQNEEQARQDAKTKKASGKQKLLDLGLTEEEVKALIGV